MNEASLSEIQGRATFHGMLARLSAEGDGEWRMDIRVTPNEEDVTEVRFVSKKHERATVIY